MTTLNDAKFEALRTLGYVGAINDMMVQWLQANGAVSDDLSTAWDQMLDVQVSTAGTIMDRWHLLLIMEGFGTNSEQINDMELEFWLAGGTIAPLPMGGFSDGFSDGFEV